MAITKKVIFAVPGSKVYISKYYSNRTNSFLNISLTGNKCELMCSHCKARLLSDMTDINAGNISAATNPESGQNRITDIILRHQSKYTESKGIEQASVNGILISGGFDKKGRLLLDERILAEIKDVKDRFGKQIKILLHLGFTDRQTAQSLYECGVDGVLVNIFSDKHAIEEVYNLKGFSPGMFYENTRLLKEAGLKVSPHLVIGLGDSNLKGEYRSIEEIAQSGADSCVFVIAKKLSKHDRPFFTEVKPVEVLRLFEYARSIMPETPLNLGCARPCGLEFIKMEKELLKLGIDSIAFPSEKTVEYAKANNYSFHFEEQCCAFLTSTWKYFPEI